MGGLYKNQINVMLTPLSGYRMNCGTSTSNLSPASKEKFNIETTRPSNANEYVGTSIPGTTASDVYNTIGIPGAYSYYTNLTWSTDAGTTIPFDSLASELYIGLLTEAPVYYCGNTTYTKDGVTYRNTHPALKLKDLNVAVVDDNPTTFLEVREIPNASYGYFSDVDNTGWTPDPTKIANGGYWTSYGRYKYVTLETQPAETLTVIQEVQPRYGEQSQYWVTAGDRATQEVEFNTDIIKFNPVTHDYELDYYASNPGYMLVGENTNKVAYPQVNYFGVFKSATPNVTLRLDENDNAHMMDNTLLYWGELTENNSWYHEETNPVAGVQYYVRQTVGDTYIYVEYTGELPPPSGTTLYKKTGVIVEPTQGGLFSRKGFQLRWCADPLVDSGDLPLN